MLAGSAGPLDVAESMAVRELRALMEATLSGQMQQVRVLSVVRLIAV